VLSKPHRRFAVLRVRVHLRADGSLTSPPVICAIGTTGIAPRY